jgi:hypothetical protein
VAHTTSASASLAIALLTSATYALILIYLIII